MACAIALGRHRWRLMRIGRHLMRELSQRERFGQIVELTTLPIAPAVRVSCEGQP